MCTSSEVEERFFKKNQITQARIKSLSMQKMWWKYLLLKRADSCICLNCWVKIIQITFSVSSIIFNIFSTGICNKLILGTITEQYLVLVWRLKTLFVYWKIFFSMKQLLQPFMQYLLRSNIMILIWCHNYNL